MASTFVGAVPVFLGPHFPCARVGSPGSIFQRKRRGSSGWRRASSLAGFARSYFAKTNTVTERLRLLFRKAIYNLRGGFLVRPVTIALVLGCAGAVLSWIEESNPSISDWAPCVLFFSHGDPAVAQVILSDIATSTMTVVSIVFPILLMTSLPCSSRRASSSASRVTVLPNGPLAFSLGRSSIAWLLSRQRIRGPSRLLPF